MTARRLRKSQQNGSHVVQEQIVVLELEQDKCCMPESIGMAGIQDLAQKLEER